ncbi:MAG: DUF2871 domain-containing protein [Oscillospiraceae bacterium]|nr:DUF2871 domain-containing protein [Oscillospiraceae bacterium]
MTKKYANLAMVYGILAMAAGVFYREFTKFQGFGGKTALSVMHAHYFLLGMFFFLVLMLIEKSFAFSDERTGKILLVYQIGLNIAETAFLARGLFQVTMQQLAKGLDASVSGVAGIGHILIGVSAVMLLMQIKKAAAREDDRKTGV